jgi:hypothetical protein
MTVSPAFSLTTAIISSRGCECFQANDPAAEVLDLLGQLLVRRPQVTQGGSGDPDQRRGENATQQDFE